MTFGSCGYSHTKKDSERIRNDGEEHRIPRRLDQRRIKKGNGKRRSRRWQV